MSRYLVLHVRPYDFEDDGRRIQGSSVTYLDPSTPLTATGERGHPPLSLSVDTGVDRQMQEVPGFYDLSFTQRRGKNGRPQLVLAGARLVAGVDLTDAPSENQRGG